MTDKDTCDLCGKPLTDGQWIDDEKYGDVHTDCLETALQEKGEQ